MYTGCTDAKTEHPICRWDVDIYCEDGDQAVAKGKSYTRHGGFLMEEFLNQFDNQFFCVSEKEAKFMAPGHRMTLEEGYKCFALAGKTKATMKGQPIGVYIG